MYGWGFNGCISFSLFTSSLDYQLFLRSIIHAVLNHMLTASGFLYATFVFSLSECEYFCHLG